MAGTLASLFINLGLNKKGVESGLSDTRRDFKKTSDDLKKIGGGFTTAFTLPAIAAGAALLKIGSDHDSMVDTIRVGTGAVGAELDALGASALTVFSSIPTTMDQAGQAISLLNQRTGATGVTLEDLAKTELELARITGGDLNTQIANTTRLFGDWGINVNDGSAALDELFRASQATGVSVDTLSESMVKFGSPMRQLGFDFETTAALIGKFEKEGVNTELVLGSLRIALGKMAKAGVDDPKKALGLLIDQIKNAGSVGEANALALETFGARAGPDMAAAIREGRFDVDELFNTMMNGTDTILDAAESTNDWRENLQILTNRLEVKLIPIADRFFAFLNDEGIPALEKIVDKGETVIKWLDRMPGPVKEVAIAFGILLVAIGPILTIAGTIIGAIGPAIPVITALLGAISLPLLAVIGAIVLLAVAWKKNWFDIRGKTKAAVSAILGIVGPFVKKFLKATETIRYGISRIIKGFKTDGIKGALRELFGEGGGAILKGFGRILALVPRLIGELLGRVKTGFAPLDAVIHNIGKTIKDVGLFIQHVFSGEWGLAFQSAKDIFMDFINRYKLIGELLFGIFQAIPWTAIGSALWGGFKEAVSFLINTGAPWLLEQASKLMGKLQRGFGEKWDSDIRPWLRSLPGKIVSLIAAGSTMLYNAGRNVVSWIWTGIASLLGWFQVNFHAIPNIVIGVIGAFGGWFYNIGRDIVSGIWTGISSLGGWLWTMVSNFVQNAIIDAALSKLHINSPSKVFAEIGAGTIEGFVNGIKANAGKAQGAMSAAIGAPSGTSMPRLGAMAGAAAGGGMGGSVTFANGSIQVIAAPGQSEERIAQMTADKIVRRIHMNRAGAVR